MRLDRVRRSAYAMVAAVALLGVTDELRHELLAESDQSARDNRRSDHRRTDDGRDRSSL